MRRNDYRIIVADLKFDVTILVLCQAWRSEMTAKQNYVWFLPDSTAKMWAHRKTRSLPNNTHCSETAIDEALEGHFVLSQQFYASDNARVFGNNYTNVGQLKKDILSLNPSSSLLEVPSYVGFVYDSIWVYALALRKCMEMNPECPLDFHFKEVHDMHNYTKAIKETNFEGLSGTVRFGADSTRETDKVVLRWINNSWTKVFEYKMDKRELMEIPNAIQWSNGLPWDGSKNTYVAKLLFVAVGFVIVACIVVCSSLYYRHHYTRRFEKTREVSY